MNLIIVKEVRNQIKTSMKVVGDCSRKKKRANNRTFQFSNWLTETPRY